MHCICLSAMPKHGEGEKKKRSNWHKRVCHKQFQIRQRRSFSKSVLQHCQDKSWWRCKCNANFSSLPLKWNCIEDLQTIFTMMKCNCSKTSFFLLLKWDKSAKMPHYVLEGNTLHARAQRGRTLCCNFKGRHMCCPLFFLRKWLIEE